MYNARRRKTVSVSDISCFLPSLSSRTYCRTLSSFLDVRTFCPLYSFDVPSLRFDPWIKWLMIGTNVWHWMHTRDLEYRARYWLISSTKIGGNWFKPFPWLINGCPRERRRLFFLVFSYLSCCCTVYMYI